LAWLGILILVHELPVFFGDLYVDGELFINGEYISKEFISSPEVKKMLNMLRFEESLAFSLPFWALFLMFDCLIWYSREEKNFVMRP